MHEDWRSSRPIDLSDSAVLEDLERHPKDGNVPKFEKAISHSST